MSRCFPFPPPGTGYLWQGKGGEKLRELLELLREEAKKEKEERRRRKKEKRKQDKEEERRRRRKEKRKHDKDEERRRRKKENRKLEKDKEVRNERHDHDKKHADVRGRNIQVNNDNQMGREHVNHGLEISTLAEELGQLIIPANVHDSFDNSHAISREIPLWFQNDCSGHGNIVHCDFQFHKDPEAAPSKQICSTWAWMDVDVQEKSKLAHAVGDEQSCTSNCMVIITTQEVDSKHDTVSLLDTESDYRKLFVNWVPPPLKMYRTDFDDEEWLSKRNLSMSERTQNTAANNDFHQGSYPYARYLPDADIYALPFRIPF